MNGGTTIVFRKRKEGPAIPAWGEGQGHWVAAHFEPSSPLRFLLSGRWILDAFRRFRKVAGDSPCAPEPRFAPHRAMTNPCPGFDAAVC